MWALTKKDPEQLDKIIDAPETVIESIPDEGKRDAIFMSEGTEADFKDYENEKSGVKKWLERFKRE